MADRADGRCWDNRRLVSSWPARGGPVLHNGRLFFAASIWPFMGIFIHAVDPDTGSAVWTNSGDGTNYTVHPHGAPSFGTVVPQGHLAAVDDALIVPGGRSTPAVYDADSGVMRHFVYDKRVGGHDVTAAREYLFRRRVDIQSGRRRAARHGPTGRRGRSRSGVCRRRGSHRSGG